ncbi:MAG: CPBP family intramembrane glutamic endopeptidase [Kofleriaceae bacterium]
MSRGRVVPPTGHGDLVVSLVLIAPLLLAYDLGVLVTPAASGVDLLTRPLLAACGGRVAVYLLVHAGAAAALLWWVRQSGRARALSADVVGPVVVEAAIYALTLGGLLAVIVHDVLGLGARGGGVAIAVVTSLGAGVHEELLFRLGAFAGGLALLRRAGVAPRLAWGLAVVASSLLFAAAHHVGELGEPLRASAFVFRALAGVAFACIFYFRSLAHAAYAHVLYDLYVTAIR